MPIQEKKDYLFYESGMLMNSKQPMKNADAAVVSTKDYVFFIPKQTTGMFVVLQTITTHQLFAGKSIVEGVKGLIEKAASLEELEESFKSLLENDEKYVHRIADKKSFKFKGFLGKHTLRMSTGGSNWSSIMPKCKGNGKEFRQFYGQ